MIATKPIRNARARLPAGAGVELRYMRSAWSNAGAKARAAFLSELLLKVCDPPAADPPCVSAELSEFIAARLQRSPGDCLSAHALRDAYRDWARATGATDLGPTRLGRLMTKSGFKRKKSSEIFWCDLRLRGEK